MGWYVCYALSVYMLPQEEENGGGGGTGGRRRREEGRKRRKKEKKKKGEGGGWDLLSLLSCSFSPPSQPDPPPPPPAPTYFPHSPGPHPPPPPTLLTFPTQLPSAFLHAPAFPVCACLLFTCLPLCFLWFLSSCMCMPHSYLQRPHTPFPTPSPGLTLVWFRFGWTFVLFVGWTWDWTGQNRHGLPNFPFTPAFAFLPALLPHTHLPLPLPLLPFFPVPTFAPAHLAAPHCPHTLTLPLPACLPHTFYPTFTHFLHALLPCLALPAPPLPLHTHPAPGPGAPLAPAFALPPSFLYHAYYHLPPPSPQTYLLPRHFHWVLVWDMDRLDSWFGTVGWVVTTTCHPTLPHLLPSPFSTHHHCMHTAHSLHFLFFLCLPPATFTTPHLPHLPLLHLFPTPTLDLLPHTPHMPTHTGTG